MDKAKLVAAFMELLAKDLAAAESAARATYEAATHEESQPENEYDTRGLEASYLASAQAKRVAEIDDVLSLFRSTEFKNFDAKTPIQTTALVELESNGKTSVVLLMQKGGGFTLSFEGRSIQIVTPNSHLGEALVDLKEGEVAEVEVNGRMREYEILRVQ